MAEDQEFIWSWLLPGIGLGLGLLSQWHSPTQRLTEYPPRGVAGFTAERFFWVPRKDLGGATVYVTYPWFLCAKKICNSVTNTLSLDLPLWINFASKVRGNFPINDVHWLIKKFFPCFLFPFFNRYPTMITTTRTLISIGALWFVGILEGVTPDLIQRIQHNQGKALLMMMHGCIQNNKILLEKHSQEVVPHFLVFMTLTVFLPSGIMLISHAWIFIISFRHYKRIRTLEEAVLQRRVTEMRAAKTAAITVFSALACFAPLIVVTSMMILEPPSDRRLDSTQFNIKYILFPSLKILYLLAISLNPLICALKSKPFKAAFKEMLQALKRCPCKVPNIRRTKARSIFRRRGHTLKLEPNKPAKNSNTSYFIELQCLSLTTNPSELSNTTQNKVYT